MVGAPEKIPRAPTIAPLSERARFIRQQTAPSAGVRSTLSVPAEMGACFACRDTVIVAVGGQIVDLQQTRAINYNSLIYILIQ
jgi:hypothetical protein